MNRIRSSVRRGCIALAACAPVAVIPVGVASAAVVPVQGAVSLTRPGQSLNWQGRGNSVNRSRCRQVTQAFGYSATTFASTSPGEIGGTIIRAQRVAYFAK